MTPEVATVQTGRIHPLAFIHEKAHVDDTVKIGAGSRVWQFASVIRGTRLGIDCTVASNVTLDGPWFGDRCIISPGVDIASGFEIGDDVFIGPNVVLCNDAWPLTSKEGWTDAPFRNDGALTVRIFDGASIGANAVILPGVQIGSGAMIAAGAVVDRDVHDGTLFKRSGEIVEIDTDKAPRRMKIIVR